MSSVIHTTLSDGRRVAIPAELCKRYGLEPGARLVLESSPVGIVVRPLDSVLRDVQAYFADTAPPEIRLSDELIADRRLEVASERRD